MQIEEAAVVRGPQGGRHVEFRVTALGTGLRSCIAVDYDVHRPEDEPRLSGEVGVSSDVSGSRVISTPIYSFLNGTSDEFGPRTLTVRALGRTAQASVDLGRSPFGPEPDASLVLDASSVPDAPSSEDAP